MDWIVQNKEWLLSGLLVVVPLTIFDWFISRKIKIRKQIQKGGKSSTNIQAGRDININKGREDKDE